MKSEDGKILITGVAGFVGAALCKRLLENKESVIGIDNLNSYYDKNLKLDRLENLQCVVKENEGKLKFIDFDLIENKLIEKIFSENKIKLVIHLAAQAGVRYSLTNPREYIKSNIDSFFNVIENCRKFKILDFIFASSSSVYGGNKKIPYQENAPVDHPISLYAATKKSNELIAHTYSHLYGLRVTGLRFFTVYGPWGRPDMAPMIFTNSIINGKPIDIYNFGNMKRDFTYIDDVVEGIFRCCYKQSSVDKNFDFLKPNPSTSFAPFRVFNIGNSSPVGLLKFIEILENELGKKAIRNLKPIQPGDVNVTYSDNSKLKEWINFKPSTSLEDGIKRFIFWYKNYYQIKI